MTHLYRAVDSSGATIDFLLSPNRDLTAAKLFLRWHYPERGQETTGTGHAGRTALPNFEACHCDRNHVDQVRIMLRRDNVQSLAAERAVAVERDTGFRKGPRLVSFCTPGPQFRVVGQYGRGQARSANTNVRIRSLDIRWRLLQKCGACRNGGHLLPCLACRPRLPCVA